VFHGRTTAHRERASSPARAAPSSGRRLKLFPVVARTAPAPADLKPVAWPARWMSWRSQATVERDPRDITGQVRANVVEGVVVVVCRRISSARRTQAGAGPPLSGISTVIHGPQDRGREETVQSRHERGDHPRGCCTSADRPGDRVPTRAHSTAKAPTSSTGATSKRPDRSPVPRFRPTQNGIRPRRRGSHGAARAGRSGVPISKAATGSALMHGIPLAEMKHLDAINADRSLCCCAVNPSPKRRRAPHEQLQGTTQNDIHQGVLARGAPMPSPPHPRCG